MVQAKAPHESRIYHAAASWYEFFFSPFFRGRILATIRGLEMPAGARVLEVGVGTGLSLDAYPRHADVTCIDLSDEMLSHAQKKIDAHGWDNIHLQQMDALNLTFADETFDYVMAFHIVTVVPDHRRLMQEIVRVCKPRGTIVVINHLRSPRKWIAGAVDLLGPITNYLGWHTRLTFENLIQDAPIEVLRRYKTSPQSLFTIVIARKLGATLGNAC